MPSATGSSSGSRQMCIKQSVAATIETMITMEDKYLSREGNSQIKRTEGGEFINTNNLYPSQPAAAVTHPLHHKHSKQMSKAYN